MFRLILIIIFLAAKSSFAGDFDSLKPIGKAELKFLGFKIYDIELRGQKEKFSYDQKLAIKINYTKNFSKKELVETSIDEISRINNIERDSIEESYTKNFERIFVDVKKGDEKIAVYDPDFGLTLFYNGKMTGFVNDKVFAKRFIDIWLSDKARFNQARNLLIGN
jgi:hypothetical protein